MLHRVWGCSDLFEMVISLPSEISPEVALLNHLVVLFLIFGGTCIVFSIVAALVYVGERAHLELNGYNDRFSGHVSLSVLFRTGTMEVRGLKGSRAFIIRKDGKSTLLWSF